MAADSASKPLHLDAVEKRWGQFTLGPITIGLQNGVTALLGANGAGKTTLMRLVVGAIAPDKGRVLVQQVEGGKGSPDVGYLPQEFGGPARVTVGDYLRFVAWCRSRRARPIGDQQVLQCLTAVNLIDKVDVRLDKLSGGMVRRVGIAQALLGQGAVLVLDEPTAGLDPAQRRDLRALLGELGNDRVVLMSTHLSEDVAAVASHVAVVHEGRIAYHGTVDGLIAIGGGEQRSGDAVERGFLEVIQRDHL